MALLFTQTITQFAPLRTLVQMNHANVRYSQLIRELFPKALFDEQNVSYELFIEIAWSFLSKPIIVGEREKHWFKQMTDHRIGGLPAFVCMDGSCVVCVTWYKNGKVRRDDKDLRTNLTLPTFVSSSGALYWYKDGGFHRDDKDPRTGLTLPAAIYANSSCYWYKDGTQHRDDKDPRTGLTLPAIICANGLREWYKVGEHCCVDGDPKTGFIRDNSEK